jgi:gamma-glutamyltranspeptidase/glutathione hydrolase
MILRRGVLTLLVALIAAPAASFEPPTPADPARPAGAAVASANAQATDAGLRVLAEGGNAYDAAVAVSATLGLVEPESSGLGGGGFFLIQTADGKRVFVDARETAPLAATRDMFLDADGQPRPRLSIDGPLAAAIPGLPAGLVHVAERYGRLPLSKSLAPAIELAEQGWRFGSKNAAMLGWRKDIIKANRDAARLFLVRGDIPAEGTRMVNRDYARTLRLLAQRGHAGFYEGAFARRLADGVRKAGGLWTVEDLARYRVVEREPLVFNHRGWDIVTAPPPSSGGIALKQIFHVLDGYDYPAMSRVGRVHLLTEAMRRAYRDRAVYLGDPDFVEVPVDVIGSPLYAAGLRATISLERATPSELLPGVTKAAESEDTTHFSIVDAEGNLVAVTQTVNLPYGNAMVVPGTGFLLNNEMDDFSVKPGVPNAFGLVGEDANKIEPGKRPLSSMTPTLLLGPERVAAIGTPGGSRIITMVLLGMLGVMDGANAETVVAAPRFHHQYLPDALSAEPGTFSDEEIKRLEARGHTVSPGERAWGNMQLVIWHRADGRVEAASDPRWKGVGKGGTQEGSIFR